MIYNTILSLSLGSGGSSDTTPDSIHEFHQHHNKRNLSISHDQELLDINSLPSLTLGLSSSSEFTNNCNMNPQGVVANSNVSVVVSSFSNSSVKRERDASLEEDQEEEFETNKVISQKLADQDDHDNEDQYFGTRKKLRLSKEQSAVLEDSFKEHSTLNSKQKQDLASRLSLRPRQVEVWFQNRRARTKLKQTEVDCEILRKCYEDLKDENRRLNKEVQELKKSLKMAAQPFRVQLSAATLTMCPSCETTNYSSMKDQKPQFYGPFTNPSAAAALLS